MDKDLLETQEKNVRLFELRVEHNERLTWSELNEIVGLIDGVIKDELYFSLFEEFEPYEWRSFARSIVIRRTSAQLTAIPKNVAKELLDETSFVSVQTARSGSFIFELAVGGLIVYPLWALSIGVQRSRFSEELLQLGLNAGNILADQIATVNRHLEEWSYVNQRTRGKTTHPRVRRIEDEQSESETEVVDSE